MINLHFILFYSSHSFLGFEKIVRMLFGKGANVNAVSEDKYSALIIAAHEGNILN